MKTTAFVLALTLCAIITPLCLAETLVPWLDMHLRLNRTIKDSFKLVSAGIQMGFNAGKDTQKVCKLLKTVGSGMNSEASTIDDDNIRMVVMMAVQQSNKAIVLICL